jgi:hypothetical protein
MSSPPFSPLGAAVLSRYGLWWEIETPVYRARLPLPWHQLEKLNGGQIQLDWMAGPLFELKAHIIPTRLLSCSAIHFARELGRCGGQVEALVWLTWDGGAWDLVVPPQEQAAWQVESVPVRPDDNVGLVLHSHGRAPAFFSSIDDRSEQDGFLYGVLGGLDPANFAKISFKFRAGHAGFFLPLHIGEIFDVSP